MIKLSMMRNDGIILLHPLHAFFKHACATDLVSVDLVSATANRDMTR